MTKSKASDYQDVRTTRKLSDKVKRSDHSPEELFKRTDKRMAMLNDEYNQWCGEALSGLAKHEKELIADPSNPLHWKEVANAAHEIKGTCSSFGHAAMATVADSLFLLATKTNEHASHPKVIRLFDQHLFTIKKIHIEGDVDKKGNIHPAVLDAVETRIALFKLLAIK